MLLFIVDHCGQKQKTSQSSRKQPIQLCVNIVLLALLQHVPHVAPAKTIKNKAVSEGGVDTW